MYRITHPPVVPTPPNGTQVPLQSAGHAAPPPLEQLEPAALPTVEEPPPSAPTSKVEPEQDATQSRQPHDEDPTTADETHDEPEGLPSSDATDREESAEELVAKLGESMLADDEPSFDFDAFRVKILRSDHPIDDLREFVSSHGSQTRDQTKTVGTPFERFLVRQLEEAELFDTKDDELPGVRMVWPHHSKTFYARAQTHQVTYASHLRLLRIEAALNVCVHASRHFDDLSAVTEDELYRFQSRLMRSVCAQVPDVDTANWTYLAMPWQGGRQPATQGEWAMRQALAQAIESAQVPYRLEATFRTNVSSGDVAICTTFTPQRVLPRSCYLDNLGIVPTTAHMRMREASRYAACIGILLANHAFRANARIRRVWVSCVEETPARHTCRYSVCFERRAFSRLHMASIHDPLDVLGEFGTRSIDDVSGLLPVQPSFYMEDERFCPRKRHDIWRMSERSLGPAAPMMLGATHVSDLSIHEELGRSIVAERILRTLDDPSRTHTTQESVRTVLDAAQTTSDFSVLDAAERLVGKLVDGSIEPGDARAVREELVNGDSLSKALMHAQRLASEDRVPEALASLRAELGRVDDSGWYDDTNAIACRSFDSFAQRCLYNRMHEDDDRNVMLVPDSYVVAHLFVSAMLVGSQETTADTLAHARRHATRALRVAPLSTSAHLGLVACLEREGDLEGARDQLARMLELAYDPQSIGLAYYRMASILWQLDKADACQACYLCSMFAFPPLTPLVVAEYTTLEGLGANFDEDVDQQKLERILANHQIPIAPTEKTSYLLYECAAASVDAEVFPVASELLHILEVLTGDDVIHRMRQSLEQEPDA